MGNQAGTIKRPNAIGMIAKNQTAVVTQSKLIVPFYQMFKRGANGPAIQPQKNWLTRG
jgi:hypothetical protein